MGYSTANGPGASQPAPDVPGENAGRPRPGRATTRTFPAVVSIHDVTPRSLGQTLDLVELLAKQACRSAALLVVPEAGWTDADLGVLRQLQGAGHELAAHGWRHRCPGIKSWTHRIHSLVLSRDLAEHLSLDAEQIAALIARSHQWFASAGLRAPELYVPPAWAMGRIRRAVLPTLPFTRYEYLTGVYHARTGSFARLPLVGFEADTRLRRHALGALNAINATLGRALSRPLRIAIHPFDLSHHLAEDLRALLARPIRFMSYAEIDAWRPSGKGKP